MYHLQSKIASGSKSSVYRCIDDIGIRYACKKMPKTLNKRYNVQNEIDTMRKLSYSTRVVKLVDVVEDTDNFFIIQELCRGGTIRDYLGHQPSYGEKTIASIIRGVLRSLYHIHYMNILHRDIKPENVLLTDNSADAVVKICDMGLSIFNKFTDDRLSTAKMAGTPLYMSPESLQQEYGTKSDIWSVGVMTYNLLSGQFPFNDKDNHSQPSVHKIWYAILNEDPLMTSSRWDNVSVEAKDFVYWLLQKSHVDRPTIKEALNHSWLLQSDCEDRFIGPPLKCTEFIPTEKVQSTLTFGI